MKMPKRPIKTKLHVLFMATVGVISVLLSTGYLYPDEHYQIIEFANALIGRGPYSNLPWEYESHIRPWFQPVLAAIFLKIGFFFTNSPFVAIKFVKAFFATSFFAAFIYYVFADGETVDGISPKARGWGGLFMASSALVAQMISRTSSEAFSAAWLMLLLGFISRAFSQGKRGRCRDHLVCGAIAGMMFYTRFQMGFVYAAIGIWLLVVRRSTIPGLISNLIGFSAVALLCTALDSFIYGQTVFTPILYYKANIVDGVASQFGVSPWYAYFFEFNTAYRAVAGVLSFLSMAVLLINKPQSLLAWIFWIFVVGHSAVGHKEERFLFPVMIVAPMAWAYFMDLVSQRKFIPSGTQDGARRAAKIFVAISAAYAIVIATRPLGQRYSILERIDQSARVQNAPVCLEWTVVEPQKTDLLRGGIVPPFYNTAAIQVIDAGPLSGGESFVRECAARFSSKFWYEVRQMTPLQYFTDDSLPRAAQVCRKDDGLDELLTSLVSRGTILSAISWFKLQKEQLYLWRCE